MRKETERVDFKPGEIEGDTGFLSLFPVGKPIMAMLHLKGEDDGTMLERVRREVDTYVTNGVDAVIVEDYFGTYDSMVQALEYVESQQLSIPYGVNCLNVDPMGFELARRFNAAFVQLDSVVGHVKPRDERSIAAFLAKERGDYAGYVLGGVRFKYQPVLSEHTVEEDLAIAKGRCDAVVVTQDATGQETSVDKVRRFRDALGPSFPLIVGAGLTPENACKTLCIADGAIVGSFFKDTGKDDGEVSGERVRLLMKEIARIRESVEVKGN